MRGTAGYDAAEGAGAEVGGGVEFDAAFALCAAAGHLGGCFFGCHCCLGGEAWLGAGEGLVGINWRGRGSMAWGTKWSGWKV